MSSRVREEVEFDRLLGGLLNSSLTEVEACRLGELLNGHPSRMAKYRDMVEVDVLLEAEGAVPYHELRPRSDGKASTSVYAPLLSRHGRDSKSQAAIDSQVSSGSLNYLLLGINSLRSTSAAAMAVATALAIVGLWAGTGMLLPEDPLFVVEQIDQAVFEGKQEGLVVGNAIPAGRWCYLKSGTLTLRTRAGAEVAIQGPAELRPLSAEVVELGLGKARVRAPHAARGFQLLLPRARITDLGTQFGVDLKASGQVITEVYEGEVLLESLGSVDQEPIELSAGWAGKLGAGDSRICAYRFGTGNESICWWNDSQVCMSTMMSARPEFYFQFEQARNNRVDSLVNSSLYGNALSGGAHLVEGGPRTTLGQPGRVLQCSGDGVGEIALGMAEVERTGAFTIAMWIKIDRLADQNVIVATNHRGPDMSFGPQLRLRIDGTVEHYLYSDTMPHGLHGRQYLQRSRATIVPGEWSHLAISGATAGKMRLYIDGVQADAPETVSSRISGEHARLLIGSGSGRSRDARHHMEPFHGVIDELAFFSRSLQPSQVAEIYEASRACFEEGSP